jgi:hypothetical protein
MAVLKTQQGDGGVDCSTYVGHKASADNRSGACDQLQLSGMSHCWRFPNVPVPSTPGPYYFSLLQQAVNDDCNQGKSHEFAWCPR